MTTSRGFRHVRTGGSSRRKTGWSAGPSETGTSLTAAATLLWATASVPTSDGLTIVRTRGEFSAFISSATTALDGFVEYAVGIGLVTAQALAIGVTAVPSPLGEIGWEGWLWHHTGAALIQPQSTESNPIPMGPSAIRGEIDSKAMRKVGANMRVIGVFEVGAEVGTAVVEFSANTRLLSKLP